MELAKHGMSIEVEYVIDKIIRAAIDYRLISYMITENDNDEKIISFRIKE